MSIDFVDVLLLEITHILGLFCCNSNYLSIPSKASDENEKENYEQAHKYHRTAGLLNAGGLINIIVGGPLLLVLISSVIGFILN